MKPSLIGYAYSVISILGSLIMLVTIVYGLGYYLGISSYVTTLVVILLLVLFLIINNYYIDRKIKNQQQ